MKITINMAAGNYNHMPYKSDVEKNIQAQKRAIDRKSFAGDSVTLLDTLSILEAIKQQLPE